MVYSLKEAINWFLSHSSGTVICVKGEEQKECDCYFDAEAFYKANKPNQMKTLQLIISRIDTTDMSLEELILLDDCLWYCA